ncbi:MAG: hypothetical protein QOJ99_834 [Bryobacterales bacterium]|nr:hypothetical protein [Bryobacterales bacterium]
MARGLQKGGPGRRQSTVRPSPAKHAAREVELLARDYLAALSVGGSRLGQLSGAAPNAFNLINAPGEEPKVVADQLGH